MGFKTVHVALRGFFLFIFLKKDKHLGACANKKPSTPDFSGLNYLLQDKCVVKPLP